MEDTGSPEAQEKPKSTPEGVNADDSARADAIVPVITINTTSFRDDELIYMQTDFSNSVSVPTIEVSVDDSKGNKFALEFPTDGDVISLYLRPPDTENLRPIRIDFDIVEIRSDSESMQYGISGVMKIPGFFAEKCESFADDTSFEQVKLICSNTGLGFASNESATDDKMPRLCPFETYETFVEETVATTYKDEDSFFTWYVDPYYYLCLVNVNKQFESKFNELRLQYENLMKEFEYNELVYNANFSFEPVIGEIYHLYRGEDGINFLSLISPSEWNKEHLGTFQLNSDKKWIAIV